MVELEWSLMLWCALGLTVGVVLSVLVRFFRAEKVEDFLPHGWVGLGIIITAEALLLADVRLVGLYFTPLVWTGYILAVDAAAFSLQRRSLIRSSPEAFLWMVILSIFLCLIVEFYNYELLNWTYVGFPRGVVARYLVYGWLFATTWPAVLVTADLLMAFGRKKKGPTLRPPTSVKTTVLWGALGIIMLVLPLLVSRPTRVFLLGVVFLGFILLTETLNYRAARPSIVGDLSVRHRVRLWALLEAGMICGFLGEFWNYWATAKWLYIVPVFENYSFFERPILGYLGFPIFAVVVFATYVFATDLLNLPKYDIGADPVDS